MLGGEVMVRILQGELASLAVLPCDALLSVCGSSFKGGIWERSGFNGSASQVVGLSRAADILVCVLGVGGVVGAGHIGMMLL